MTTALDQALDTTIGVATQPRPAPPRAGAVQPLAARQQLLDVRVNDVTPDPDNPREDVGDVAELAHSMATTGLLQPIVARRRAQDGRLVVVAGHRRLAAAQHLGWTTIPVIVRRDMRPDDVLAAMLVENGQRKDLDPIEEARALARLRALDPTLTAAALAARIGRHQTHVSARLALLALPVEEQEQLRAGQMNLGDAVRHARLAAGTARPKGYTGAPHLGVNHTLSSQARARCTRLKHKAGGRNSVGGVACGACWESVIRADERVHLHAHSATTGQCALCGTAQP